MSRSVNKSTTRKSGWREKKKKNQSDRDWKEAEKSFWRKWGAACTSGMARWKRRTHSVVIDSPVVWSGPDMEVERDGIDDSPIYHQRNVPRPAYTRRWGNRGNGGRVRVRQLYQQLAKGPAVNHCWLCVSSVWRCVADVFHPTPRPPPHRLSSKKKKKTDKQRFSLFFNCEYQDGRLLECHWPKSHL